MSQWQLPLGACALLPPQAAAHSAGPRPASRAGAEEASRGRLQRRWNGGLVNRLVRLPSAGTVGLVNPLTWFHDVQPVLTSTRAGTKPGTSTSACTRTRASASASARAGTRASTCANITTSTTSTACTTGTASTTRSPGLSPLRRWSAGARWWSAWSARPGFALGHARAGRPRAPWPLRLQTPRPLGRGTAAALGGEQS